MPPPFSLGEKLPRSPAIALARARACARDPAPTLKSLAATPMALRRVVADSSVAPAALLQTSIARRPWFQERPQRLRAGCGERNRRLRGVRQPRRRRVSGRATSSSCCSEPFTCGWGRCTGGCGRAGRGAEGDYRKKGSATRQARQNNTVSECPVRQNTTRSQHLIRKK